MPIIVGAGGGGGGGGGTPTARLTWTVEVDADPDTTGEFVLDSSSLDGPDVLSPDERWVDVGAVVRKINTRRGRNDDSGPYNAGESVVEFDNRTGDFDPDNPYSRYVASGRQLLGVGTGLRVTGNAAGGSYERAVANDGGTAYWPMDETSGTTAVADLGGINGTYGGAYTLNDPAIGAGLNGSVTFAGGTMSTGVAASTLNAPFSVEIPFSPTTTTGNGVLVSTRNVDCSFQLQALSNGTVFNTIEGRLGNGSAWFSTSANATGLNITAGSINHLIYAVTTSSYSVFLNGALVGSGFVGGTTRFWDPTRYLQVADSPFDPAFLGRVSNVRVYPTALTLAQAQIHNTRMRTASTADITVFTGRVENPQLVDDQILPTATYTSVDLMAALAGIQVPVQVSATGSGDTSSDRAKWLLDQAMVPASLRSVGTLDRQVMGTTGEGTVRDALQKVANGEGGRFYVDRTGLVTLTPNEAEFARSSVASFNDDGSSLRYMDLDVSPGVNGVVNTVNVKRTPPRVRNEETGELQSSTDLPDVVAADDDSVATYGRRQESIESVLLNDADALSLATFRATRRAQPVPRLTRFTTQPLEALSAADAQTILALDIGSLITVVRHTVDGRGLTFSVTVEGINIDAVPGTTRVTLFTAPADTAGIYGGSTWFTLDVSLLDGSDVLAPY